jgi:hypothetical protein
LQAKISQHSTRRLKNSNKSGSGPEKRKIYSNDLLRKMQSKNWFGRFLKLAFRIKTGVERAAAAMKYTILHNKNCI